MEHALIALGGDDGGGQASSEDAPVVACSSTRDGAEPSGADVARAAGAVLRALRFLGKEQFLVHPKGGGVVCVVPEGIPANTYMTSYLGEMYSAARWAEKQEVIEQAQRAHNHKPVLPDFWNIMLERPRTDPRGYDVIQIDASLKANFASRMSHSCTPNVTTEVARKDGRLTVALHTVRHVAFGEELCIDYNAATDSADEMRAAICLCGTRAAPLPPPTGVPC